MLESSKVKLSSEEVFNNKKLYSEKIHARVLKVTEEVLKSFDKFKIVIEDKNLFLNAINHYYSDLCEVIFHLRQVVIQIDDHDKQSAHDLQEVIIELNKFVHIVQESLNLETEKLIIQVKSTVSDVSPQVEKLITIIAYDNLHEHKQKILDIQHDLVSSVQALKLYCQLSTLSFSELEGLLHEELEKTKGNLIQVKTGHEHLTEDFSHYTRHSIQKLQNLLNYLQKHQNIENYPNAVRNIIKNALGYGVLYIDDVLEAVLGDNPMSKMLDVIENCHKNVSQASLIFQNGFQAIVSMNIERKDTQKLKQLLIYTYVNGINEISCLNQSIEDAIMKK